MSEPKIPFSLRLTPEEHTQLKTAAGSVSMATYARSRLFGDDVKLCKKRGLKPIKDKEALARALRTLGASEISQNLRTLSDAAKSGCLIVDSKTQAELSKACADVKAMRRDIMKALGVKSETPPSSVSATFLEVAE